MVIADAQALAQDSRNLAIDNGHTLTIKRELAQLRLAHPLIGRLHSTGDGAVSDALSTVR